MSYSLSEQEYFLNSLLRDIHSPPDYEAIFRLEEEGGFSSSGIYLLPAEYKNNELHVFFHHRNKLLVHKIGLCHAPNETEKRYYHFFRDNFSKNSLEEIVIPHNEVLYLPLRLTPFTTQLGRIRSENGFARFIHLEGSPFPVFGVHRKEKRFPLMFAFESEKGLEINGLYKSKEGKAAIFRHSLRKECNFVMEEFLRAFYSGRIHTYKRQQVFQQQAQKQDSAPGELPRNYFDITSEEINWYEPKSIVAYLNKHVVGQEKAKQTIATAFSNYMVRLKNPDALLKKKNILCIGPSGTGKTFLISLLCEKAALPFVDAKLTGKTSEGYIGENFSNVFLQLRSKTQDEHPYGIVFIDEIDKIARGGRNDIGFGKELQNQIIGMAEEQTMQIAKNRNEFFSLNTRNLFFVAAGAFGGVGQDYDSLNQIIARRINGSERIMGFEAPLAASKSESLLLHQISNSDLNKYGLMTELIGRFPIKAIFDPISTQQIVEILKLPEKSILQEYHAFFQARGYLMMIDDDVLPVIAQRCPSETGARALEEVCSNLFAPLIYDPEKFADENKVIALNRELAQRLLCPP